VLPRGAARLAVALAGELVDGLEPDRLDELWHKDVHRPSHASADVRRAASDCAELGVHHEHLPRGDASLLAHPCLDGGRSLGQAGEHGSHVAAVLHGDDAQVVALVHPVHERLVRVVEHAAPVWPVLVVARRRLRSVFQGLLGWKDNGFVRESSVRLLTELRTVGRGVYGGVDAGSSQPACGPCRGRAGGRR
jgi:hypothetical protein